MSFNSERVIKEGLTYDDVLLVPAYSEILPREVTLKAKFSRNIELNTPVISTPLTLRNEADDDNLTQRRSISEIKLIKNKNND